MLKRLEDLSMLAVHNPLPFNADQFLLDNLKTAVVLLDARFAGV